MEVDGLAITVLGTAVDDVGRHDAGRCEIGSRGMRVPRAQTRSEPEGDGGGECHAGQEVGGELVIARCYATEVLETAERVLDQVAAAVAAPVMADGALAVAAARNDRCGTCRT